VGQGQAILTNPINIQNPLLAENPITPSLLQNLAAILHLGLKTQPLKNVWNGAELR
jgi:hypothetical protein